MTVAFGTATDTGAFTVDTTFVHTPAGTPKAVVLMLVAYNITSNPLVSATYGGVTLTHLFASSPLQALHGGELDAWVYTMFKGSGIPTGPQTVAIDLSGTPGNMRGVCVTLTASRDTALETVSSAFDQATANPSLDLTPIDEDSFCLGHCLSGQDATASLTAGAGMTNIQSVDFGAEVWRALYRTTNPTTDSTVDWTAAALDWTAAALAVSEVSFIPTDPRTIIVGSSRAAHRAATW